MAHNSPNHPIDLTGDSDEELITAEVRLCQDRLNRLFRMFRKTMKWYRRERRVAQIHLDIAEARASLHKRARSEAGGEVAQEDGSALVADNFAIKSATRFPDLPTQAKASTSAWQSDSSTTAGKRRASARIAASRKAKASAAIGEDAKTGEVPFFKDV